MYSKQEVIACVFSSFVPLCSVFPFYFVEQLSQSSLLSCPLCAFWDPCTAWQAKW